MATATRRGGGSASDLETGVKIGALTGDDDMSDLRWAALAGAAMLNVNLAQAVEVTIQLPPLADAILNGNTDDLDPVLLEALSGDFTFALGISIGSAFAADNVALAEAFTSAIVLNRGQGSGNVSALAEVFAGPELTRVIAWVEAQASARPEPVSPD